MENSVAKPFSEERMAAIIAEFKAMEYESGITKRQVFAEQNLIYLANFRQQFVTVDVDGMERMSFHDPDVWVGEEVEAYLYYELANYNEEVNSEKLKEQIFYRIIKNKLHVGIKPGAEYEVTITKNDGNFDCLIKVEYYSNVFCPEFYYFVWQLDKITEIIGEALLSPNAELTYEEVESFLSDGEEKQFYKDDDDDDEDSSDYYDSDRDEYEQEYRSRSMEEQGYDDYDYIHGGGGGYEEEDYEPEYDEEYEAERQHEKFSRFFHYATVTQKLGDDEILLQE